MKTTVFRILVSACAGLFLFSPSLAIAGEAPKKGWAPASMVSIRIRLVATEATNPDDLGSDTLFVTAAKFRENISYEKVSRNVGRFTYTDDRQDSGVYSGTVDLTFKSATTGKWFQNYTGSRTGTTSGSFRIISMNLPKAPVAEDMKVEVIAGKSKTFRLRATGSDIPNNNLRYQITRRPKVGRLVGAKGLKLTYTPKRGFTGKVTFKYLVVEGKTMSKPATVTLRVVKGKVKSEVPDRPNKKNARLPMGNGRC